jgi:hypothetical protein
LHQGHSSTAAGQSTGYHYHIISRLVGSRYQSGRICFHPVPTVASSTALEEVEFLDKTVVELRKSLHSLNNSFIMDKFQSRVFWGTFVLIVSAAAAHEGDYNPAADLGEFLGIALT